MNKHAAHEQTADSKKTEVGEPQSMITHGS